MTIKVARIVSTDLFTDNSSLLFNRQEVDHSVSPIPRLGAVTFVAEKTDPSQKLRELAVACGTEAFSLVNSAYGTSFKPWLFVSDGPWRDATRITLHQRLWKNHRDLLDANPHGIKSDEIEIKVGSKVRYAGLLEITEALMEKAIDSIRVCSSFAIIYSRRADIISPVSVNRIFHDAFAKHENIARASVDWLSLAVALCPLGDLLMRVSGLFDDHEVAVDLITASQNLPALE